MNKCIYCGAIIPEGRWLCPSCEEKYWAVKKHIEKIRRAYNYPDGKPFIDEEE